MTHDVNKSILRDLEWLVTSEMLVNDELLFGMLKLDDATKWLKFLQANPSHMPAGLLESCKPPIGRYFEKLVSFWFQSQKNITSLHQNVPVTDANQTLGEFDLLFNKSGQTYHLELAIKFYLGTGDRTKLENWHGPMARDRFDLKLNKLEQQQLLLSKTVAGKRCLAGIGITDPVAGKFVKGRLFHPFTDWECDKYFCPDIVNSNHEKGWWLYHKDHKKLAQFNDCKWIVLEKPNWFASVALADSKKLLSTGQLIDHINEIFMRNPSPLLVAAVNTLNKEVHRGFIQPDSWPSA